jgi:predicted secreted protein
MFLSNLPSSGYKLIYTVGLYKTTAIAAVSLGLYSAAMNMFGFGQSNLISFRCEAGIDVSVLLNSIHCTWWSAIVFHNFFPVRINVFLNSLYRPDNIYA